MGRPPIQLDAYIADYERLDALSRTRALDQTESLRLEECVKRLDQREYFRRRRQIAAAVEELTAELSTQKEHSHV